jgi:hypothetical protein
VALALDQGRRVSALEQASAAGIALVEALRVGAVEEVHARGELRTGALDEQVVVRAHLRAGDAAPPVAHRGDVHEAVEVEAVLVVAVEELATRRSPGDVVEAVRQLAAGHARHRSRR